MGWAGKIGHGDQEFYEVVKLERGEDRFEPNLSAHIPLSPNNAEIFFFPSSTQ